MNQVRVVVVVDWRRQRVHGLTTDNAAAQQWTREIIAKHDGDPLAATMTVGLVDQPSGRLLPEGTETRTEWATRLKAHGEYAEELCPSFSGALMTEEERARHRAEHWRRRFGAELADVMRRDVHTTPWTEDRS